ncbi:MAG: outer membrane protein transport protein [Ignavibacteriales bacterium]|nr:outer membrane protein transport protein [Ignavibacteriales bacterium]
MQFLSPLYMEASLKRAFLYIVGFVLPMLFVVACAFAGGFQLNEHGARALAQGGAFAARASDLSALYFNPAGLAFQKGTQIYIGSTLIAPRVSFFGPDQLNTNQEIKMVDQTFFPINVYAGYQLMDDIQVAIGVGNPYGLGTEWPADWTGKFISTKVDLVTFFITPTIAYKVNNQFSIGVGVNYVTGDVTIKRVVSDPFDPHASTTIKASATSWGFNVGALYKFSSQFSVGASYRSQVKLDATGTATFDPNRSVYPAGDVSSTLKLPATGFFGVSYKPMENLSLEADYQYIGWSSYKELAVTFKKDNSTSVSPKNYEDTYMIRLGGEYTMGDLQLRAGYYYDHSPVPTKYVEPLLPDANRNGISVGFGYKLNNHWNLDVAYLFLKANQRKAAGTEVNFDGTYNNKAYLFGVNVGYTF